MGASRVYSFTLGTRTGWKRSTNRSTLSYVSSLSIQMALKLSAN